MGKEITCSSFPKQPVGSILPALELKFFHLQESSRNTLFEEHRLGVGEATAALFLSEPTSNLDSTGPQAPTVKGSKSLFPAQVAVSLRATHPTGCPGSAAATNGTISVLLGVAVGSGKQEVVLK